MILVKRFYLISIGITFFTLLKSALLLPRHNNIKDNRLHFGDDVQNYLMEFGYLPKSDSETGNLRSETQLHDAIKTLQRFANLAETGIIDEPTRKLLKRPRCGVSDNPDDAGFVSRTKQISNYRSGRRKRFTIQGNKWEDLPITWSLVNQSMLELDVGQVRRVLTEAFNVWAHGVPSLLSFREVNSKDADIRIMFARRHHGDGYDFDGPGQVLAHAFYPGADRGGDAHFDADEKWILIDDENAEGTSLMGVAVHEFGHSLGLGHSSVEGSIMFPWYHGYTKHGEMPEDDRLALIRIYGNGEKQWSHNPYHHNRTVYAPSQPRRTTTRRTTTTTTTTTKRPYHGHSYYPQREYYPNQNTIRPDRDDRYDRRYNPTHKHHHNGHRHHSYSPSHPTYYPNHPGYQPQFSPNQPPTESPKPKTCDTSYDAITIIRNELFIFKDRYLWRIGDKGLYGGYPHEINRLWDKLPSNFTHVDAVYENKQRKIVFFIGRQIYSFNTNELEEGYPKPLTSLGLPESIDKIDAALVWGHNNKTYIYSGTMYWRYDEDEGHVELDYPRDMSIWRGIPYDIDSAFQYKDGKTYFFKGKGYWEFNDWGMMVAHRHPKSSALRWMKCEPKLKEREEDRKRNEPLVSSSWTITVNGWSIIVAFSVTLARLLLL